MKEIKPDFERWADKLTNGYEPVSSAAVESALEEAYQLGLNKGWALEQDKQCFGEMGTKYERIPLATIKSALDEAPPYNQSSEEVKYLDKEKCEHTDDGLIYYLNPPMVRCSKCGEFYR